MKLVTYKINEQIKTGVLQDKESRIYPWESFGFAFGDMMDVIARLDEEEKQTVEKALAGGGLTGGISLEEAELLAPIPHPAQDILCMGVNYFDHARECGAISIRPTREKNPAIYFAKRVNEAVAPYGSIQGHTELDAKLDYEVELAVIIGRDALNVKAEEVENYIFGYTIMNDVSARSLQKTHMQWYRGKSLDGFTPMGPCIVTADEIAYPPALRLESYVNGELRQNNTSDHLIHDITEIITEISTGMTLKAGTIIATGTPSGVAMGMKEPAYLKTGDVVECRIEGIGAIVNTVR